MSVIKSSFPNNFFGFYDGMTSEYAPGLLKYDVCMTEQVSGPQGTKIAGRHMAMIPYCNLGTQASDSDTPPAAESG